MVYLILGGRMEGGEFLFRQMIFQSVGAERAKYDAQPSKNSS